MIDGGIVRPASLVEGNLADLTDGERAEVNRIVGTRSMLPDAQVMVSAFDLGEVVVRTRPVVPVITSLNELG